MQKISTALHSPNGPAAAPEAGPSIAELCQRMGNILADIKAHPRCPNVLAIAIEEFEYKLVHDEEKFPGGLLDRREQLFLRFVVPAMCELFGEEEEHEAAQVKAA